MFSFLLLSHSLFFKPASELDAWVSMAYSTVIVTFLSFTRSSFLSLRVLFPPRLNMVFWFSCIKPWLWACKPCRPPWRFRSYPARKLHMMLVLMEVIYCSLETGGRGKGVIMYARNLGLCFVVHCCLAATVHAPLSRSAPWGVSPPQRSCTCECCTPLGLMYLCLVHSCRMREDNYRGDCMHVCEHVAFCVPLLNIVWILGLFAALNSFLYVCLCLYIPQCCVK